MAMSVGPNSGGVKSEINITPLVDVVLVLLIIFMVVTPMLQRGKDVTLPKAQSVESADSKLDPIVVSVTAEKSLWLETTQHDEASFGPALEGLIRAQPGRKILIKGDEQLTFDDVKKVMKLARASGASSVALGVEELK